MDGPIGFSMQSPFEIRATHNLPLRAFLSYSAATTIWLALASFAVKPEFAQVSAVRLFGLTSTYLLPMMGLGLIFFLSRFNRQGTSDVQRIPLIAGWIVIAFCAGFDLFVTIVNSPNLADEGNYFVRILLDTGHSLPFVYVHWLSTQMTFVTTFCLLWLGFIKHRGILLSTLHSASPRSLVDFLRVATGGAELTTRQWLFPVRISELPFLYHGIWVTAVTMIFGNSIFRCYAAFEWLGLIQPSAFGRNTVVFAGTMGALLTYFVMLWKLYRASYPDVAPLASAWANNGFSQSTGTGHATAVSD